MDILQSINLDFARNTMPVTVFTKQYDKDTRKIEITPLNNGASYTIENGVTPRLQMTKPDGTTVINNASISSGKIVVTLSGQCLTAAGTAVAEIGLYKNSTLLTSQTFYINIQKGAYDEDAAESSDEYGALVQILADVQSAVTTINNKVDKSQKIADIGLSNDIAANTLLRAINAPYAAWSNNAPTPGDNAVIGDMWVHCYTENHTEKFDLYLCTGVTGGLYGWQKLASYSDIPDISVKENSSNKVTSLSSNSTNAQYPSAKCVYDLIGNVETLLSQI